MEPVICFEMLYEGSTPEEKIRRIAASGFRFVEFWGWRDKDIDAIGEVCRSTGVKVANFSGQRVGDLVNPETHPSLIRDYESALQAAATLGTDTLMVLTQELGDGGVVVNAYPDIPDEAKKAAVVAGLKEILERTPDHIRVVLESLNTVLDHKGYYFHDLETGVEIMNEVNDPRLKILCDFYHQGMMGDDPIELIERYLPHIGYIHIADVPGRHEPGTGRVDWKDVLLDLKERGYDGFVGFEYAPDGDSDASLKAVRDVWDSVL